MSQPVLSSDSAARPNRLTRGLGRKIWWLAGIYSIVAGSAALAGWTFDQPRLTDWTGGGISMFISTALCAVLGGMSLLLLASDRIWAKIAARVLASGVA